MKEKGKKKKSSPFLQFRAISRKRENRCGLGLAQWTRMESNRHGLKSTSIIAGMKFKSNLLCRSAPQSANFPPTFPLKGNAMESMQRTLRGRHSVRRELRIFEILEALLAREIIERSSFATPSRWIGSIQSSIRRPLRSFKNKIIVSRLRFNSLTWFFEIFLAKIAKESGRRNLFFFLSNYLCSIYNLVLYKESRFFG